jgi:hypothetical protein
LLWQHLFFLKGKISQVTSLDIQKQLIILFTIWGLPKCIRVDNGKPLGDPQRKSITILGLWLVGLGIKVIYNRPRRPTDNAKVERMQQTTKNWAAIKMCKNQKQLKEQLEAAIEIQRKHYKVTRLKGKTRMEAFPEILDNPRKYNEDLFDIKKAYLELSKWTFARRISSHGQFCLYDQVYYLGTKYARQHVSIKFNAELIRWQVSNSKGDFITNIETNFFSEERIKNLTVSQRTFYKKGQTKDDSERVKL